MTLGRAITLKVSLIYPPDMTPPPVAEEPGSLAFRVTPRPIGTPGPLLAAFGPKLKGYIVARVNAPEEAFSIGPSESQENELASSRRIDWR
jgi:hypothetical protein